MDPATPLRTAEFLVVDTETNGLAGDACELTEVGAVLVGGGELHDRWETLVATRRPLSKGIQRFTGITQAMVDDAPPAEASLPELAELLRGRVLVAHSAAFDRRVLAQAFERAGLDWPDPLAICTVAMARRLHPLARQRKLVPLAGSLGIEVETAHRALADAETCARVFCALFPRLCASARDGRRRARAARPAAPGAAPRARARPTAARCRAATRRRLPDMTGVRDAPGVYIVRNDAGQVLYVGKSVRVRTRVRAHFAPSSPSTAWTARAETVEHQPTAHGPRARCCSSTAPCAGCGRRATRSSSTSTSGCGCAAAWTSASRSSRSARRPRRAPAVNVGPLRGRATAVELVEQLVSLFGLRHCGRRLPRRDHPSAYGEMGRCLSPCLGDLDPNLYRRRLDAALGVLTGPGDGGRRLLAHVDGLVAEASAAQRLRARRLAAPPPRAARRPAAARGPRAGRRGPPAARPRRGAGGRDVRGVLARARRGRRLGRRCRRDLEEIRERTAAALRSPGPGRRRRPRRGAHGHRVGRGERRARPRARGRASSGARLRRFLRGAGVDVGAPARTAAAGAAPR